MHKELEAVFDQHANPAHASKRHVHDIAVTVRRMTTDVQKQILEFRALIGEAEMAPHDHALDGKLEAMHQTFGALERDAQAISHASRELAKGFTQLERYMETWRSDIEKYEARAVAGTTADDAP